MEVKNEFQVMKFSCDTIFHPLTNQTAIFEIVENLIPNFLNGTNCTIFA